LTLMASLISLRPILCEDRFAQETGHGPTDRNHPH
jgi:hypothetical protein